MLAEVDLRRKASEGGRVTAQWRDMVATIIRQVLRAFTAVLAVVAEEFNEEGSSMLAPGDAGLSKGRVDCRGHLIMDGADASSGDVEADGQLAVTAAWLVVKECTLLLGALLKAAPLPTQHSAADGEHVAEAFDSAAFATSTNTAGGSAAGAGSGAGSGSGECDMHTGPSQRDAVDDAWLLDSCTVFRVCKHLVHSMLTMKHIGGICFVASGWEVSRGVPAGCLM